MEFILSNQGEINFVVKSISWPGLAAVEVSLISIYKGVFKKNKFISGTKVDFINSFLDENRVFDQKPYKIHDNLSKSFVGSILSGKGFVLDNARANELLKNNAENSKVIFPYLGGENLNNNYSQLPERYAINFHDWPEEKAKLYPECYEIVKNLVYPERSKVKRKVYRENWWQYAEPQFKLYKGLKNMTRVLLVAQTSKTAAFSFVEKNYIYAFGVAVFIFDTYSTFCVLQSTLHNVWAWKFGSTMKTDLRYTPSDVFETFPFQQILNGKNLLNLELIGEQYHIQRIQLMVKTKLGLTKIYNAFHAKEIRDIEFKTQGLKDLDKKIIDKQFGKEVWNLWNHLQKTPGTCSIEEAIAGIIKLRELHVEMDNAVLEAYGWQDVQLKHDFYEVDYLPENDRIRYTIHPEARKEILKRLLELNHKIHEEEVAGGLWDKKKPKEYKTKTSKTSKAEEPEMEYRGLFD